MNSVKKVLVISSKKPVPICDGAAIRTMQMTRMLAAKYDLVDLVYCCPKASPKKEIRIEYCNKVVEFVEPKWKSLFRTFIGLFKRNIPLQCSYFYSDRMHDYIRQHIDEYDFVFCNNVRTATYVEKLSCKKVIDFVDAISMNYLGTSKKVCKLLKPLYSLEANRLINYEQKILSSFDKSIIISKVDKEFILSHQSLFLPDHSKLISVIGNYISYDDNECVSITNDTKNIVFVGSMFYKPNILAVTIFSKYIFPLILEKIPNAKFYIVGSRPSKQVKKLKSKNIIVTGFVENPKKYLHNASVVVAPMYTGAGVQNKILEAMSIGCSVVTTSIGAEGLENIIDGKHLYIRNDYKEMADIIVKLMNNIEVRKNLGINAKQYISENLTYDSIFEKFQETFKEW